VSRKKRGESPEAASLRARKAWRTRRENLREQAEGVRAPRSARPAPPKTVELTPELEYQLKRVLGIVDIIDMAELIEFSMAERGGADAERHAYASAVLRSILMAIEARYQVARPTRGYVPQEGDE